MSTHDDTHDDTQDDRESVPALGALARALGQPPVPPRSLLPKIQERIHQRTRGRYFRPKQVVLRDPITLALLIALVLAVIATAAFLVFMPLFEGAKPHDDRAAPIDRQAPHP